MPMVRPWQAEESLSELTLHLDWDNVTSMILSLRVYLFEHGTIPTWNFMFCGGRPELAVPFSWAYTWPSAFGYLLPPNHALLALWLLLTGVGFFATRALLVRWSGSAWGATLGACTFALCGCFAMRFNAGHVSFAFFHLVPLMLYVFETGFDAAREGRPLIRSSLGALLVSFLFMTAALPHGLIHFYPAFLALVVYRLLGSGRGSRRAALAPLTAHGLGIWLAAYKLWPVIQWQLQHPREGVELESYGLLEVIGNTLELVPDPLALVDARPYPLWEYSAFVGPLPWLLALVAVGFALRGRRSPMGATGFGVVLVWLGLALSLGNDTPLAPGYFFEPLPMLGGVRAFPRYQILIVLGLAVLLAQAWPLVAGTLRETWSRPVLALLVLGILAPLVYQDALVLGSMRAKPISEIQAAYGPAPEVPSLLWTREPFLRSVKHKTAALDAGYWIGNCVSDLSLPHALEPREPGTVVPLSSPPPTSVASLGTDRIALDYSPDSADATAELALRVLDGFELRGSELITHDPAPLRGAIVSGLGLVATGFFFALVRRSEQDR